MSFLYPSFLWALAALAIPVIIHLFNFRRTTRVMFTNTRFLKQVKEASTAKRKLKHYLILASRLLFLLFLVLAFAQPIIPAQEQTVNYRNVVFYLDNSQSMSIPLDNQRRGLDAGIAFITDVVKVFPAESRYRLITNDFAPFSNSYKNRKEILELLSQVRISPLSRSVQEVRDRVLRDAASRDEEVFWVSDFQISTSGKPKQLQDSTIKWHLVPIDFDNLANVFVDTVYLDNPFASTGERNVVRVRVRNDGSDEVQQLSLKLTVNGIQMGTSALNIPGKGVGEATFDLSTRLGGLNRASISFNDAPVTFDNEFFFSLNLKEKIRILEIRAENGPTPIEKVFGNQQVFTYRGFDVSNFNYSALNDADLVVVNGLDRIESSLALALNDHLAKGGSLFVIPGANPDDASMKSLVQLPGWTTVTGQEMQELDKPDFNHPFFQNVFEEKTASILMPKALPIVDWGTDRSAILSFKNDKPFLSAWDRGGKLYLMSTPLRSSHTDFYNHALFVPVMYRMAASSKRNESKLYYNLKDVLMSFRIDSIAQETQVRLVSDEEIIPSQRRLGNQVQLELPRFSMKTGYYKVVAAGDTVDLVAFNADKSESLLQQYDDREILSMFGGGTSVSIFDGIDDGTFSNEIKKRYLGVPLWKYAVFLALLFLAAEVFLIRFLK